MNTKTLDQIKDEYYGEVGNGIGSNENLWLCASVSKYEVPERNWI